MRHPRNTRRHLLPATGSPGRRRSVLLAMAVAVSVVAGTAPAAVADRDDRAFPSRAEVDAAEERAAATARDVAAIKAELVLANRRLEDAAVAAEQAAEAFNGAQWRLDQAQATLAKARADARRARSNVAAQRAGIAALVTQSYISGGAGLGAGRLGRSLSPPDPELAP